MIPTILVTALLGQTQPRMSLSDRPGWLRTGEARPLYFPGQKDGALSFDDIKAMPYAAIVRPEGAPTDVTRRVGERDLVFGTQRMRVLSGPNAGGIVDVLVWQPLHWGEPFNGFRPLNADFNYLLMGDVPHDGKLGFASGLFVNTSSRPTPDRFHRIPAHPGDIAGWSLVRTPATRLPVAPSREETVLRAVVEACATTIVDPDYDATTLVRTIHSERDMSFTPLSKMDRIGDVTAEAFYQGYVIPTLQNFLQGLSVTGRAGVLDALAKWKVPGAEAQLRAVHEGIPTP